MPIAARSPATSCAAWVRAGDPAATRIVAVNRSGPRSRTPNVPRR